MSPLDLGTIVITGGGSRRGIGRATALRFAADGYAVAVLDIDGQAAADTADEAAKAGSPQTFADYVDVTDEQSVQAALRAAEAEMPPVTVLANIAGISAPTPFEKITLAAATLVGRLATPAEVARTVLGAPRARVRGQLAAGISVWDYDDGTVQVVVPGNVGGSATLTDVVGGLALPGAQRPR
jgi:2-hydroxycyclohexanecarboxyl-CoA dehydrogenase